MTFLPFSTSNFVKGALVSTLALSTGYAMAQDNRIQLRSLDGAMSLEGAFIGFRDGVYVLDHDSLGTLRIEGTDQIICEGSACPGNEEPETEPESEPVIASKTVQLTTGDGRLSIEGDFVEVSSGAFVIDSPTLGRLSIDIIPGLTCIGDACPDLAPANSEKLIAGSSQEIARLLPALLEAYAAAIGANVNVGTTNEEGQVPVELVNSDGSLAADFLIATQNAEDALAQLADRSASLVLSNRRITDRDISTIGVPDLRGTSQEHMLAQDGLVVATHSDNPVSALSTAELAALWSGQINNWLSLGGGNVSVSAGAAFESASLNSLFEDVVLAPNGGSSEAVTAYPAPSNLVSTLQSNAGGIGVLLRSQAVNAGLKMVDIRDTCGLLSRPTEFDIKNGGYVLGQDVYSYSLPQFASSELTDFANWISSPDANAAIEELNLVNSMPGRMSLQDMGLSLIHTAAVENDFSGAQFAQVVRALRNAERSSATFRFEEGSATLDQDSRLAINEMAQQIRAGVFEGFEVLLVGFSDSSGDATANTALALQRAQQVETALTSALAGENGNTAISTLSAGELMPMACNTSADGRERNRRVEAWIRLIQG